MKKEAEERHRQARGLLAEKDFHGLKSCIAKWHPNDVAGFLERLKHNDRVIVFRLLDKGKASDVFSEMGAGKRARLLKSMGDEHNRQLLSGLSPDDRTSLFEELPGEVARELLDRLPDEVRRETLNLLGYPKDSVGRLMTPKYITLDPDWTAAEALSHIQHNAWDAEIINWVYAVDKERHLLEDMPIRRLILAKPKQKVRSLFDGNRVFVSAFDDQEVAVEKAKKYNMFALPVVDSDNVLVGIVTLDDLMDVADKEFTEDAHLAGSVSPLKADYMEVSPWKLYGNRVVWLVFLAIAGFFAATVIAGFEEPLKAVVALAFFIPILIGSGGNTGIQSATLVLRALATNDLTSEKWLEVLKKELVVGLLLGATLGLVLFGMAFMLIGDVHIGFVLALSTMIIILWANLAGCLLPIALTKMRLDPAVVSSPLITTLIDVFGLFIYFSIAVWWLAL